MSTLNNKKTTSNLLNYLEKNIKNFQIDRAKRQALCFREKLEVYSKKPEIPSDTKPIGNYCISVERIGPRDQEFLVYVFSTMTIRGSIGGSKVISSVTDELHCLEEKRTEFSRTKDNENEKNLFLGNRENCYYIRIEQKLPSGDQKYCLEIPYDNHCKFISEGCNILLMRCLAMTDFTGILCFEAITIDGTITISEYECSCGSTTEVNGINLEIYEIKQKLVQNKTNIIHQSRTTLTKQGKIVFHDWIHTDYMMKINPSVDPLICTEDPIILPLREVWKDDIEMMSKYLDKKTNEILKQEKYLIIHSEINHLIADYVQTLLCRKPTNVLSFTIEYFSNFTPMEISESSQSLSNKEYSDSENRDTKLDTSSTKLDTKLETSTTEKQTLPCKSSENTQITVESCEAENSTDLPNSTDLASLMTNCGSCTVVTPSTKSEVERNCEEEGCDQDCKGNRRKSRVPLKSNRNKSPRSTTTNSSTRRDCEKDSCDSDCKGINKKSHSTDSSGNCTCSCNCSSCDCSTSEKTK